ncbi:aldo/keto reductase [Candidatus Roizmanbacteria bacterium CG_4_9_14_0_2_um_filter_39_13]|uniref:Protein tas n=1 Tax=Candidatus Roizmanbacteria bacterium CG_4_9_14_0_2_um_filter_39_13 TaxID=1974839 RepID=A0A2M8EZ18_9BACT|nr:MAG: aldo/keto reductase [Candidatus Roizmanbacteria bacterium CG_4_10_14_0_2_um_filter_39_12]PJC31983.1 MAG: aldo/keto reductase [Candidatus Roizmanbacteria bacterium CG_4_9_14_0_2_um_filter_39_13]
MKYRKLGTTDIDVSVICLGTMNWGEQNTESEAYEQMDYAVSQDINFFDTAEFYAIPPHKQSQGSIERFIGNWLKKTGKRKDLIIASKIVGPVDVDYMREWGTPRLDRKNIKFAVEGSLKRLQTDYIDLYQIHWPERKTNYFGIRDYTHENNPEIDGISIEETLTALKEMIDEGKIRHIGLSNETAWGTMEYLRLSKEKSLSRIQSIQNPYSLIMREYENSLAEISVRERVSLLVYSPLSHGVLVGKYLDGAMPKKSRFGYSGGRNSERYNPAHAQIAIKAYINLAKKHNLDPAQMALSFVNDREFVTSNIIGATTMEQLKADIGSIDITLDAEVMQEIEKIHLEHPNPIT